MLQAMGVITNAARHQRSSEEVDEVPHDEGGDDSDLERHEAKIAALEVPQVPYLMNPMLNSISRSR